MTFTCSNQPADRQATLNDYQRSVVGRLQVFTPCVIPYSGVWAGLTDSLLKDKIEKGGELSLPKANYKKILAFILGT